VAVLLSVIGVVLTLVISVYCCSASCCCVFFFLMLQCCSSCCSCCFSVTTMLFFLGLLLLCCGALFLRTKRVQRFRYFGMVGTQVLDIYVHRSAIQRLCLAEQCVDAVNVSQVVAKVRQFDVVHSATLPNEKRKLL